MDAQKENATQSLVRQNNRKYLQMSENDRDARERDRREQEYRDYQEEQKMRKREE